MIVLKRAYDARTDGTRFLVERLWPRGISKATLRVDAWLKEVGHSMAQLRQDVLHDDAWRRRYVHYESIVRLFQRVELARKQVNLHEVIRPTRQARTNERRRTFQIHPGYRDALGEHPPIALLEC